MDLLMIHYLAEMAETVTIAVVDDYEADRRSIADFTGRFLREQDGSPTQFFFFPAARISSAACPRSFLTWYS